ncbi:MAG: NAD(+) diphosphatase [Clostridiales bacterium]|nr:NAD(+) diphosphatase [Clostridiales bacterium]
MIQDILPKLFHVEYHDYSPAPDDTVFLFEGNAIYFRTDEDGNAEFPKYHELESALQQHMGAPLKFRYMFSIDEERFFMPDVHNAAAIAVPEGYDRNENSMFRISKPRYLSFACTTAQQLFLWYESHKYCGRCGEETGHSDTERSVVCPKCGLTEYPKISPVVIVAVTHGESILVTRYKGRPGNHYALVAGFGEIGETHEDTARREVFEETGVHIKNMKYYKSQPWGFSSSLLTGFFCELDGDPAITVDETELSEALWLPRNELPPASNDIALTAEMMEAFRTGVIK